MPVVSVPPGCDSNAALDYELHSPPTPYFPLYYVRMGKNSKKKNASKPAEPKPPVEQKPTEQVEAPPTTETPPETDLETLQSQNKTLLEQNEKAKKIVKAQKEKCKKIEDELEKAKSNSDEWESVTQRLHKEIDTLKEKEQNLLSSNAELTKRLEENDPKELTEKLTDKNNELDLIRTGIREVLFFDSQVFSSKFSKL